MSKQEDRVKNSKRRYKDEVAVERQVGIAKQYGLPNMNEVMKQPHRLAKHHAMDCGNPKCFLCGNPRKTHKDKLTAQEKRLYQNLDNQNVNDTEEDD